MCGLTCLSVLVVFVAIGGYFGFQSHKNVGGPHDFDVFTSTQDVLDVFQPDLKGMRILVTGARKGGLGFETARALLSRGATVLVHTRSQATSEKTVGELQSLVKDAGSRAQPVFADLGQYDQVVALAKHESIKGLAMHRLILNAGVMMPGTRREDGHGHEIQMGVNHLGHTLLARSLLDELRIAAASSEGARVISLSSAAHAGGTDEFIRSDNLERAEYSPFMSYCDSKLANIFFAQSFDKEFQNEGIRAFSLHPGGINTNLQGNLYEDESWTAKALVVLLKVIDQFGMFKTIEQGAATSVFVAVAPMEELLPGGFHEDVHISAPIGEAPKFLADPELVKMFDEKTLDHLKDYL